MRIVTQPVQTEEIIKKSRFIGCLIPCASELEAKRALARQYQTYSDASHIVFAYRIQTGKGLLCRFNDAGEPSGTAGKPVFQHLEGKQLINALLIVVRYFGGIKLGAGGLTRAYGNIAKKVIEQAEIIDYIPMVEVTLSLDYKQLQALEYQIKQLDGRIIDRQFGEKVTCLISVPEKYHADLCELFQ
jgi:uncharacterized YigZ family protein